METIEDKRGDTSVLTSYKMFLSKEKRSSRTRGEGGKNNMRDITTSEGHRNQRKESFPGVPRTKSQDKARYTTDL